MSADAETLSDCFVIRPPTIADAIRRKTNESSARDINRRVELLSIANVAHEPRHADQKEQVGN